MKRLIAIGLVVNAMLLAAILLRQGVFVHAAGGGGGVPLGNGDVNGDGLIDISDAVYLLSNLFTGGPAVQPIECPAPAGKGPPATGQAKCYDASGVEVACDSATCPGQDGLYTTGCSSEVRFVDNGDGTVTDNCTGLMWQRDLADASGDGTGNTSDLLPWCEALSYCQDLGFAGHDDWRLPNLRELQSIVDYGRIDPAMAEVFAGCCAAFWSSTTYAGHQSEAWLIVIGEGNVYPLRKDAAAFVRAVRNAQ